MSPVPRAEVSEVLPALQQEIARLAGLPEIRHAFAWRRLQEAQFAAWQLEMARIAAPPFGERARGEWLAQKFIDLGLEDVHCDDVGNVFGISPGRGKDYVAISAHIDTVFPAGTPLNIRQQGARLYGPGVSDNGAGATALLAVAGVLGAKRIRHSQPFLFIGNVGEAGEGDLPGMRMPFRSTPMSVRERLEHALRQSLDTAIEDETRATEGRLASSRKASGLSSEIVVIGNRPAGELDTNARILQVIRAVDSHLGNAAQIQRASTDANIPLSLGREAIAIGGGGAGGGAHTLQEWFDCSGRELGLKRILLAALALAGVGA